MRERDGANSVYQHHREAGQVHLLDIQAGPDLCGGLLPPSSLELVRLDPAFVKVLMSTDDAHISSRPWSSSNGLCFFFGERLRCPARQLVDVAVVAVHR